jgi:hypothetical protein
VGLHDSGGSERESRAGDSVILVPEQYIERIEIRFVRSDDTRTVGFTYGTLDEQD